MHQLARHAAAIHRLRRDGDQLWFGAADGAVGRIDVTTGEVVTVATLGAPIVGLARAGATWLAATEGGELAWIGDAGIERRVDVPFDHTMLDLDVGADGRIALAGGRERVHILSPDGEWLGSGLCSYWAYAVRFSHTGRLLTGNWQGAVFDVPVDALIAGERMTELTWLPGPVFALAETACGIVAVGADDQAGFVAVIDPATGEVERIPLDHAVHAVAPAADGSVVFVGGNDESVRLLRLPDLVELGQLYMPTTDVTARQRRIPYPPTIDYATALPGAVTALAAAPDGSAVHAAFADGGLAVLTRGDCERASVTFDLLGMRRTIERLGSEIERLSAEADEEAAEAFDSIIDQLAAARIAELRAEQGGAPALVDRWCRELPAAIAADVAASLGETYADAALAVGWIDPALRWARSLPAAHGALLRHRGLMRLALALGGQELWIEAFATIPDEAALVELLLAAPLDIDAVRELAHDRVIADRGAAAVAWYAARAPLVALEQIERPALVAACERALDDADSYDPTGCAVALAAALWLLHAGDPGSDLAQRARAFLLESVPHAVISGRASVAQRAAIAAGAKLGVLAELDPERLVILSEPMYGEMVDAFVDGGDIDGALAFIDRMVQPARLFARLARRAPGDVRAQGWIERAEAAERELEENELEGLFSREQGREARLELVALRGPPDQPRARNDLAAVVAGCWEGVARASAGMLDHLRAVRDGARGPAWPVAPPDLARLDTHLAKWEAAREPHQRPRVWRSGLRILEAAAALAAAGELDRARELIDRVADGGRLHSASNGPLIAALVAVGELDRALFHAEHAAPSITPDGTEALVVRLAELDRSPQALGWLARALDALPARADRLTLAPAVLAIAPDPRAAATAMLEAWDAGAAARAAFTG